MDLPLGPTVGHAVRPRRLRHRLRRNLQEPEAEVLDDSSEDDPGSDQEPACRPCGNSYNPRFPGNRRMPRWLLVTCAIIACFGLLAAGVVFGVFIAKDAQRQSLATRGLKLDESGKGAAKTAEERYDSIGVLKGSVVETGGTDFLRRLDTSRRIVLESVVPLIAYVMSKVFAVILRNFLEVRYTARHGVSMKRLLLIKCAADPLYAFFGDRMPKFWNRQANPLQLNGQYNYGMRALPRDLVGPKILPACLRSMLSTLYSWGSRLWRVRVVLGAALAYNFALFLVELAPNYGSAGIQKPVDPVGGSSNFTLDLVPQYIALDDSDPLEFVGLRKCTPFRMEVEGVVGGRNELVNAFMACGTYYEVSEIGEKSELDDRGVCSWANSSNPDRVEVYSGNSACSSTYSRRGTLNIRFRARNYGFNETERKLVGVSLTSNPFNADRVIDPQVSFNDETANGSPDAFEALAKALAKVVTRYNNPVIYKEKRQSALEVLSRLNQIPDTAVIELTEAIVQNIFFSSTYNFVKRSDSYCKVRPGECLGVKLGLTTTRRAFLIVGLVGIGCLLIAKFLLIYGTGKFYLKEISTVFEDAVFSSLHGHCASDYTEDSDAVVRRGWTLGNQPAEDEAGEPVLGPQEAVVHYNIYLKSRRGALGHPAGVRKNLRTLMRGPPPREGPVKVG